MSQYLQSIYGSIHKDVEAFKKALLFNKQVSGTSGITP